MDVVTRLTVRVQPGARRSEIVAVGDDGVVRVRVAAPPVAGQANGEVLAVLAAALNLRPRALTLVRGAAGRTKIVEVVGLSAAEALTRLRAAVG